MSRKGFSLIEMITVVVLIGIIAAIGFPRLRDALEKQNVRSAKALIATMAATARGAAIQRGCAATLNMTPTKTGAAKAIDKVLPELTGRIVGIAVRVPIPDVSLVDLNVTLERPATVEEINDSFRHAATGPMGRVLDVTDEPLVSSDFHGDTHSAIVDLASTRRGPEGQAKVLAWYDNEGGYAARVVDVCRMMGAHREYADRGADRPLAGARAEEN